MIHNFLFLLLNLNFNIFSSDQEFYWTYYRKLRNNTTISDRDKYLIQVGFFEARKMNLCTTSRRSSIGAIDRISSSLDLREKKVLLLGALLGDARNCNTAILTVNYLIDYISKSVNIVSFLHIDNVCTESQILFNALELLDISLNAVINVVTQNKNNSDIDILKSGLRQKIGRKY